MTQFIREYRNVGFDQTQMKRKRLDATQPTKILVTINMAMCGTEIPEGVKTTRQERAYTSPIWYTP